MSEFSKKTGYTFSDPSLLEMALTHASIKTGQYDNERLEFLGDRILGLAIADLLFRHFPTEKEGKLAKRHTGLVQQEALVRVSRNLGLAMHLKLSPSEMKSGGHQKEKILADALEALIGAIYVDGGFPAAFGFIEKFWGEMLRERAQPPEDAKSQLQEWAQAQGLPLPEYKQVARSGTDHAPLFEIQVSVKGKGSAAAKAASKRAAEKAAALLMLGKLGITHG
jgi:ribonuclease-3